MLNRLLKVFGLQSKQDQGGQTLTHKRMAQPLHISRSEHSISRTQISENALKVLYRLKKHGYEAYLVGGGVRDILLGLQPKDFDVVTNALPEQIRNVFNNCRLIGRRFRLAHVYFGRDIIEVATFRGQGKVDGAAHVTQEGMLLRDNEYGTIEEDVWRRDFTINALYYNIKDFSVVDFTGGMKDIQAGVLRMIGDPEVRFREDPVRMLRAIRLAYKLDFALAENLHKPIESMGYLLEQVASARIFEETLKMFHSGHALNIFRGLKQYHLFNHLFPLLQKLPKQEIAVETFIEHAFHNTDLRIKQGKTVNPAFLFACILWHPMRHEVQGIQKDQALPDFPATMMGAEQILHAQKSILTLPRRLSQVVKEIWIMQLRLEKCQPKRVRRMMDDPRFRAAYDFLLLRHQAGEPLSDVVQWWQRYVDDKLIESKESHKPHRRKRRGARKKKPLNHSDNTQED